MNPEVFPDKDAEQASEKEATKYQIQKHTTTLYYVGRLDNDVCEIIGHFNTEDAAKEYCKLKAIIDKQAEEIEKWKAGATATAIITDKQAGQLKALEKRRANEVFELRKTIESIKRTLHSKIEGMARQIEEWKELEAICRGDKATVMRENEQLRKQIEAKDAQLKEFAQLTGCLDPGEHGQMEGCECLCCIVLKGEEKP